MILETNNVKQHNLQVLKESLRKTCSFCSYTGKYHYIKRARIRSFSGPYFPTFGLNTEIYRVVDLLYSYIFYAVNVKVCPNLIFSIDFNYFKK